MNFVRIILAGFVTLQMCMAHAVSPLAQQTSKAQATAQSAKAYGPGSTGGGEPTSQEARAIVTSLPSVLRSTGLQYFPEVDIDQLENITQGGVLVELAKESIVVNGAPKALRFNKELSLIEIDSKEWAKLSAFPNSEVRKRALIFHEVLGLMGIEKNNDYTISNRLIGAEFLAAIGIKGTTDQILPSDAGNKQVIYWRISNLGRVSFFYCQDRTLVSSCVTLGSRSYTTTELDAAYREQYKVYQDAVSTDKVITGVMWGTLALGVTLLAVSCFVPFLAPVAGPLGAASLLLAFPLTLKIADDYSKEKNRVEARTLEIKQLAYLNAGATSSEYFDDLAKNLNKFLHSVDASSDATPQAPTSLRLN